MMKSGLSQSEERVVIGVCSMCGALPGDFWETRPRRKVVLRLKPRHSDFKRIWTICDECDQGLQNAGLPKPDQIHLLAQIRRATITDQETVLAWLLMKFNLESVEKK